MSILVLRGRHFSEEDLDIIRRCVADHFDEGRTQISIAVCNQLNWKQPNGWPKDRACRDVLLKLEAMGHLTLPPRLSCGSRRQPAAKCQDESALEGFDLTSPVSELPDQITLEFAKGNKAERIWNSLVGQYHYLGHTVLVGRCIKYLARNGDRLLGCLAFSSPAWRLTSRDSVLRLLDIDMKDAQDLVINNSRFLILPNIRVRNLASTMLSLATDRIVHDWSRYYSITPLIAETFVQPSLYYGTSYKAANWIDVGETKGYAKKGSSHHNSQESKRVFLYGLNRHIRRKLLSVVQNTA